MIAYKLFRKKANGAITSLFIDKTRELPIGVWMTAHSNPTKGYAERQGWHCLPLPYAPHLTEKGRVWYRVEIELVEEFERPESQGGKWLLAQRMRILEPAQRSRPCHPLS